MAAPADHSGNKSSSSDDDTAANFLQVKPT